MFNLCPGAQSESLQTSQWRGPQQPPSSLPRPDPPPGPPSPLPQGHPAWALFSPTTWGCCHTLRRQQQQASPLPAQSIIKQSARSLASGKGAMLLSSRSQGRHRRRPGILWDASALANTLLPGEAPRLLKRLIYGG